jgi:hypothetical protein
MNLITALLVTSASLFHISKGTISNHLSQAGWTDETPGRPTIMSNDQITTLSALITQRFVERLFVARMDRSGQVRSTAAVLRNYPHHAQSPKSSVHSIHKMQGKAI